MSLKKYWEKMRRGDKVRTNELRRMESQIVSALPYLRDCPDATARLALMDLAQIEDMLVFRGHRPLREMGGEDGDKTTDCVDGGEG
jgi:hypothetical protein